MASKKAMKYPQKDVYYVQRLVLDVLLYTQPKFGVPDTELPYTNSEQNVYKRANFLEIAGATILGISLIMRDTWRRMFDSRLRSSGLDDQNVSPFLAELIICCPLSHGGELKNIVQVSLALSSELMLFVRHKGLRVPFSKVVAAVTAYILCAGKLKGKGSEIIEELFDPFGNIFEYTRWITDFITNFAIPYESSHGVSDIFLRDDVKKYSCKEELSKELNDIFGSNSADASSSIPFEDWPENLVKSNLQEGLESPKLLVSSESRDVGGNESDRWCQSTQSMNASDQTSQDEGSDSKSIQSGIEDVLEQMSLGAGETSQNRKGAVPKRKKNSKRNRKHW